MRCIKWIVHPSRLKAQQALLFKHRTCCIPCIARSRSETARREKKSLYTAKQPYSNLGGGDYFCELHREPATTSLYLNC